MINRAAIHTQFVCDSSHLTDCLDFLTQAPRGDINDVVTDGFTDIDKRDIA